MIDIVATFKTFMTNNFTIGNVTSLTAITTLTQQEFAEGDYDVTANTAFLLIQDKNYDVLKRVGVHKNERYTLKVWLLCENETQQDEIEIELDRIFGVNNNTAVAKTEEYEVTIKDININPYIQDELIIVIDRLMV